MRIDQWPQELLTALSPLLDLLSDSAVTDIMANGFDDIWVKRQGQKGHHKLTMPGWRNDENFRVACIRIAAVIGRSLGPSNLMLDARLPGGQRVNIALPPACERIALTIRCFGATPMTFANLERLGSASPAVSRICEALVLSRQSIVVAGGTGAGKTSLLNALTGFIPVNERVVTVEDARELQLVQPNWVALETVEGGAEGTQTIGVGALVRNALRQNPDRIIVGEVRGDDAFHLLRAFSTGHGGGFGTVHANDCVDALHQLQLLAQMGAVGALSSAVAASMVGRAVDIVIFQKLFACDNRRRVSEIVEVEKPGMTATERGIEYLVRPLARWDEVSGRWVFPTGPSDRLIRELRAHGKVWPELESASSSVRY